MVQPLCGGFGLLRHRQDRLLQINVARGIAGYDFKLVRLDGVFHVNAVECKRLRRDVKRNRCSQ